MGDRDGQGKLGGTVKPGHKSEAKMETGKQTWGLIYCRCVCTKGDLKDAYASFYTIVATYRNKLDSRMCAYSLYANSDPCVHGVL